MALASRLKQYIAESRQELKKVNWPTKKQATNYTLIVIGLSVAVALFLGALDLVFAYGIKLIIKQ